MKKIELIIFAVTVIIAFHWTKKGLNKAILLPNIHILITESFIENTFLSIGGLKGCWNLVI